jgi:putative transposase
LDYELVAIDEVSFQLTTSYKRIWFLKGERPKGAFFWSNKKLITFGALTSNHEFYYDFYDAQNSLTFCNFLRNLFDWLDPNKKYVLILDNAGFHKTSCVKNLLKKYGGRIAVEHIPPYSPELNPIETSWKVTKHAVTKSQYFASIDAMQEALEIFWEKHIFKQDFITYLCR